MIPIKKILPLLYEEILKEKQEIIAIADADPDKWYELFITKPGDQGTESVESGDTFMATFAHLEKYIEEYRFDRIEIDIWQDTKNPEPTEQYLIKLDTIYNVIEKYYTNNEIPFIRIGNVENRFSNNPIYYKDETENGYVFKDEIAFLYFFDLVCYVSEYDEEEFNLNTEERIGCTYQEFIEISETNTKVAQLLFEHVDWQHPLTLYNELETRDTIYQEE